MEHGQPDEFLRGTSLNNTLNNEDLESLIAWWPIRNFSVGSRSSLNELARIRRAENPSQRAMKLTRISPMELVESANAVVLMDPTSELQLQFSKGVGGDLQLKSWNKQEADLLNVSRDAKGNYASLLVRRRSDGLLHAIYLSRQAQAPYGTDHRFIFKRPLRWKSPLIIELCGEASRWEALAREAADSWQKAIGSALQIQIVARPEGYPPFTDLNHHGIYLVNGYRTNPNQREGNVARTYPIDGQEELLDGDIFVFTKELEKVARTPDQMVKALRFTFVHELGHLLGLDHPSANIKNSVMAYGELAELQDYDIKAIREIYPAKPNAKDLSTKR